MRAAHLPRSLAGTSLVLVALGRQHSIFLTGGHVVCEEGWFTFFLSELDTTSVLFFLCFRGWNFQDRIEQLFGEPAFCLIPLPPRIEIFNAGVVFLKVILTTVF